MSLQEDMPCVTLIFPPSTVRPSASTASSRCSTRLAASTAAPTYPPYNIERTSENDYRITVAVAGFADKDIAIEVQGEHPDHPRREAEDKAEAKGEVLHQGIAARAFERRFQLADYVQVTGASWRTACSMSTSSARSRRPRSPA